jgi:predicted dehydrogenase/mannose-6-phosphate isomerase-like protein (cupin superfamily)
MRILHVGLGDFGSTWLELLLGRPDVHVAGVVDRDAARLARARAQGVDEGLLHTDLVAGLRDARPDLVLLTTPPQGRLSLVRQVLAHGTPVLLEKPAALDEGEAGELLALARDTGAPLHIAENYRHRPLFTTLRELLEDTAVGTIRYLSVDLVRHHRLTNYHATVPHPLLVDVASHHLDVIRFLTGQEVDRLDADVWRAPDSWYTEPANAVVTGVLDGGARFRLRGSLDAPLSTTDWTGAWTVETAHAVLRANEHEVSITRADGTAERHSVAPDDGRQALLDSVLGALRGGEPGPTLLQENLRSLNLSFAAVRAASRTGPQAAPERSEITSDSRRPDSEPDPDRLAASIPTGPAGARTEPAGAPRVVRFSAEHEPLTGCHGGVGTLQHRQLLSAADFAGPIRFVNHTVLPPGTSIGAHRHGADEELYLVLSGNGLMTADGRQFRVQAGDVVVNQPYGEHGLVNDGPQDLALVVIEVGLVESERFGESGLSRT